VSSFAITLSSSNYGWLPNRTVDLSLIPRRIQFIPINIKGFGGNAGVETGSAASIVNRNKQ